MNQLKPLKNDLHSILQTVDHNMDKHPENALNWLFDQDDICACAPNNAELVRIMHLRDKYYQLKQHPTYGCLPMRPIAKVLINDVMRLVGEWVLQ